MIKIIISSLSAILMISNVCFAGYGSKLCSTDVNYSCYKVQRGDTWQKLFPDEERRKLVMRINRMNIKIHAGMTIAIPNSETIHLNEHSPLPREIDPPGKNLIMVNLSKLAFGAYDPQGTLVHWGPVSGGKGYCADVRRSCNTKAGKFSIKEKRGKGCFSTKFPVGKGGAPMPYCMFFHGGFALHGSYNVPGYNDSHGCVRLFVDDAQWLNQEFTTQGPTTVIITR